METHKRSRYPLVYNNHRQNGVIFDEKNKPFAFWCLLHTHDGLKAIEHLIYFIHCMNRYTGYLLTVNAIRTQITSTSRVFFIFLVTISLAVLFSSIGYITMAKTSVENLYIQKKIS